MATWNTGPKNGMWTGGRTVTPHGYVLIRVGESHHLSDIRGYAYEHRLVAERMLGRKLRHGEVIHHKDGNTQNNTPENLLVIRGPFRHRALHRKRQKGLRMPGEENRVITCKCGCGGSLKKYDPTGRPRRFIYTHHNRLPRKHKTPLLVGPRGTKVHVQ